MKNRLSLIDFIHITFKYKNLWAALLPMHILGLYAIIDAIFYSWHNINFFYMLIGYFCIMILGVTICYHRLISHKSFETHKSIKYVLLLFALMSGQGSPIFWTSTHRDLHHPHSDKELDPHSPNKGLITSWFLWLWKIEECDIKTKNIIDLLRDPIYSFCHKHYIVIYWIINTCIALIDVDLWLWFMIVPSIITFHSYSLTNSLTHMPKLGYRNYDTDDKSTNTWWLFPFILGECWHNNHHGDVKSSHFGRINSWEFDPSGVIIDFIRTDR